MPGAGAGEDAQGLRVEVEANITKVRIELTQLVNTMMETMQAEAERRAETMLQKLTRMLRTAPKIDNSKAALEPTSGHSTQMSSSQRQIQPTRAAQPSWAAIASTRAQKMAEWTTVTNGKKKTKKHSLNQRRILFVRNAQSSNCDPRDIMFEVNRALANARAHVTVRRIMMGYTDKGNLTGVVGENACADEIFAYAPAVMAAVHRKWIIDLTLSTHNVGALTSWGIDWDRATTSDLEVIVFAWMPLRATAAAEEATSVPNWNIDELCANEQAMEEAAEHWRALSEGRPLVNSHAATEEELEAEAFWIQNSLKVVLDTHAPGKVACARSKRRWTAEIKQMRKAFAGTRRAYKDGRTSFDEYRRVRND
jgi:hypothetical protein